MSKHPVITFIDAVFHPGIVLAVAVFLGAAAQGRPVQVAVVSSETESPLTNASVSAQWEPAGHATTGPGPAPLRFELPEAARAVRLTARSPGFVPQQVSLPDAATSIRLSLPSAQTLSGTVGDDAGHPVAGVAVFLNLPRKLTGPKIPINDLPIVTDAAGHWQADWVPANVSLVRVQLRHPDFETPADPAISLQALRDGSAKMVLHPLVRLEGIVLDPSGKPVPNADVVHGEEDMLWGIEENMKTRTDADGRFRFDGLRAKRMALAAYSPRYAPVATVFDLKPGLAPVVLKLAPPRTVSAKVVDKDGQALPGVNVRWDEAGLLRYPGWNGVTDLAGSFQITNSIDGTITVDLTKEGFMEMSARLQSGTPEQTLTMPPIMRFRGTVRDSDGHPIKAFTVTPGMFWGSDPPPNGTFTGADHEAKTYADGTFGLTITSPAVSQVPPPIQPGLRIKADGFQTKTVGPLDSDSEALAVVLEPFRIRKLRVLTPDGQPATGAELRLARNWFSVRAENGRFLPLQPYQSRNVFAAKADEHGDVVLDDIVEPRQGLVVHDSGFQVIATTPPFPAEVRLDQWSAIEGSVSYHGQPVRRESVALVLPYRSVPRGTNVTWSPHPLAGHQVVTDDEGRFRFDRVPPGQVGFCLTEPANPAPGMGQAVGEPPHSSMVQLLELKPGETNPVSLKIDGTDLTGRIVLPQDAPPNYDWRYAGVYLIRDLPAIAAPKELDEAGRRQWFDTWLHSEAARSIRTWVNFRLPLGRDGQVNPAGRSTSVQADGTFRFRAVSPGEYQAHIHLMLPGVGQFPSPKAWESTVLKISVPETAGSSWSAGDVGWTNSVPDVSAPEPDDRRPVTVAMGLGSGTPAAGTLAMLKVRIRVAPGHHIYAADEPAKTYTPLSLTLKLPEGWKALDDWIMPTPTDKEGHRILLGDFFARRQVLVPPNATGEVALSCDIRAQACNVELCWPPKTLTAETTLHFPTATSTKANP